MGLFQWLRGLVSRKPEPRDEATPDEVLREMHRTIRESCNQRLAEERDRRERVPDVVTAQPARPIYNPPKPATKASAMPAYQAVYMEPSPPEPIDYGAALSALTDAFTSHDSSSMSDSSSSTDTPSGGGGEFGGGGSSGEW